MAYQSTADAAASASAQAGSDSYGDLAGFGFFTSLTGSLMSAVGAYYGAQAQQSSLRSQAAGLDFQESMSHLNAREAESDAQAIFEAGAREKAGLTLSQGRDRAAAKVSQAASGTELGTGSNAEALASQRYLQQLDAMTLDANTVRSANQARMRGVNESNRGRLARVSAANLRGTAGTINPYLQTGASLLGSAGTLASQWIYLERYRGGAG